MRCEVAQVIQGAPASVIQGQQCLQGLHAGVKELPAVVTLVVPAVEVTRVMVPSDKSILAVKYHKIKSESP